MNKEHGSHIFDSESNRPLVKVVASTESKIQGKKELSQPIQPQSIEELKEYYPTGKRVDGFFIVENDQERIVFDQLGRETEHTTFKTKRSDHPNEFDVQSRVTATYDDEGYLEQVTRMDFAKYGFIKTYVYEKNPDGSRILNAINLQHVGRAGLMEPGPAVGEVIIYDFSDVD